MRNCTKLDVKNDKSSSSLFHYSNIFHDISPHFEGQRFRLRQVAKFDSFSHSMHPYLLSFGILLANTHILTNPGLFAKFFNT